MKRSAERVLFRVDAGPDVGLGHLHRCMALAHALRQRGMMCAFILYGDESSLRRVAASGYRVDLAAKVPPGGAEDVDAVLKAANDHETNAVVIDSYHVTAEYLMRLRAAGLRVIVIDDLAQFSFPCHIVINFGVAASQLPYESSTGDTIFLLGPQYALLPPEFSEEQQRPVRDNVENILVTVGGVDSYGLMPKILHLTDELAFDFSITAIVGPFFTNREEIERIAKGCRHHIRLVQHLKSIHGLMIEADVAISAGGYTLYELVATGTPTVTVQVAKNQAKNILAFAERDALLFAGVAGHPDVLPRMNNALRTLIGNKEERARMSASARHLLDGLGAERVAAIITTP